MNRLEHFEKTRRAIERAHWLDGQSLRLFERSESVILRARDLLEQIAAAASDHRGATE
jgi:hypothetical protein